MKTSLLAILCLVSTWVLQNQRPEGNSYVPVHEYDPSRNAQQDIDSARQEAQRTNKRVLIQVGGNWASWCHTMDKFFAGHKELLDLREKNYIMVDVNFSKENQNREVLSHYPKLREYPHFLIEEADGTFLFSQATSLLEEGNSYNSDKVKEFLLRWAPAEKKTAPGQ